MLKCVLWVLLLQATEFAAGPHIFGLSCFYALINSPSLPHSCNNGCSLWQKQWFFSSGLKGSEEKAPPDVVTHCPCNEQVISLVSVNQRKGRPTFFSADLMAENQTWPRTVQNKAANERVKMHEESLFIPVCFLLPTKYPELVISVSVYRDKEPGTNSHTRSFVSCYGS